MISRDQKNIEVLKLLKSGIVSDALKEYTGWGGLRDSIYNRDIYYQLKTILTDAEIANIKATLKSAYFTPKTIIQFMYAKLEALGFQGGRILEPAAGHGAFIEYMPAGMRAHSEIVAVEIEQFSVQIMKSLYPQGVTVHQLGFEQLNVKNEFDLVIGNPPYSSETITDLNNADLKEFKIHHYFFAKGFRALKHGGILAMVLPSFCLDNQGSHVREIIYKEGGRLLAAYRLPDDLFADAKVTVDLVFIKKDRTASQNLWQKVIKTSVDGFNMWLNEYYLANPQNVFGDFKIIDAYGRKLLTCKANENSFLQLQAIQEQAPIVSVPTTQESKSAGDIEALIKKIDAKLTILTKKRQELVSLQQKISNLQADIDGIEA